MAGQKPGPASSELRPDPGTHHGRTVVAADPIPAVGGPDEDPMGRRARVADLREVRALLEEGSTRDGTATFLQDLLAEIASTAAATGAAVAPAGRTPELLANECSVIDRLRAHQLAERARFALSRILDSDDGPERLELLFTCSDDPASAGCTSVPAAVEVAPNRPQGYVPRVPGQKDPTLAGFFAALLPRVELIGLSACLDSTIPWQRREIAQSILVLLGLPVLLDRAVAGSLPLNRIEKLLPKARKLSLAQLHMLDEFLDGLDGRLSAGRFLTAAARFIDALDHEPLTPAQARERRRLRIEDYGDGTGALVLEGPLLPLECLKRRTVATAKALLGGRITALGLMPMDAGQQDGMPDVGDDQPLTPEQVCARASLGFDPAKVVTVDDRDLDQLVFDLLAGSLPQTTTTVAEAAPPSVRGAPAPSPVTSGAAGSASVDAAGVVDGVRHHIRVICPTDGTWLRRQASVNVTVPLTTLLRMDDRPAVLGGRTPLPAEFAREIAAHATVWNRILTDPSTGVVLDEATRTYTPDRATRTVVNTKWQTCSAPGCTRPAEQCEFEHGIPFDHDDPAAGGPTHPSNGHPMCRACHDLKTAGVIRMERTSADEIEWSLPLGLSATTVAPPVDDGGVLTQLVRNGGGRIVRDHGGHVPACGTRTRPAVTSSQASAHVAAEVFARLTEQQKQSEELRAGVRQAALDIRQERTRALLEREERLGSALRRAVAERRAAVQESLRAKTRQDAAHQAREELEARTAAFEHMTGMLAERERNVARVERAWWEHTRDHHLRRRAEEVWEECVPTEERLARVEQFAQVIARPGVCRHSDLDAERARMRAEQDGQRAGPGERPPDEDEHRKEQSGEACGGGEPRTAAGCGDGDRSEAGVEATECAECEAEFAAFLIEVEALSGEDIEEFADDEALAEDAESELERVRAEHAERHRRQRQEYQTRAREMEASLRDEQTREYQREGRRLGRERARLEHRNALAADCPADCCVAVRSGGRPEESVYAESPATTAPGAAPGSGGGARHGRDACGIGGNGRVRDGALSHEWVARYFPSMSAGHDLGFDTGEPPPF